MKKLLTTCLLLTLATASLAQQTKPRNTIGLSIGWQNFRMHDQHASPLIYGTNSIFPTVGLSYRHQNQKSLYEFKLSGAKGNLNPQRFGVRTYGVKWNEKDSFQYNIASAFINANIEAAYYRAVPSLSGGKVQSWVGGRLHESAYFGDEVANLPWLFNTLDFSPSAMVDYQPFSQHRIGFRIDVAALGLVTRAVYSLFAKSGKDKNVPAYLKQGTRLASVGSYRKVNFQFDYSYSVTRHFEVGAAYHLRWMHYSYLKPLKALEKRFDIRLAYTY